MDVIGWLLEQGGPAIRYRTALELAAIEPCGSDAESLKEDLLRDSTIQRWLGNLHSYEDMVERRNRGEGLGAGGRSCFMHGSTDKNLEIVLPKLGQLGLRAGMPALDHRARSWRRLLVAEVEEDYDTLYPHVDDFLSRVYAYYDRRLILATSLVLAGYRDPGIERVFVTRLAAISGVMQQAGYGLFEDPTRVRINPRAWAMHTLKGELYAGGNIKMPYVHDVLGWGMLYWTASAEVRASIDAAVRWMLAPCYQELPYNCGYIQCPDGRGKSVGHKLNLAGYFGHDRPDFDPQALVLRCWQMALLPAARSHPWLQSSLEHLEQFATGRGTYLFPSRYLTEARDRGYWVLGARMGLGEDRRRAA